MHARFYAETNENVSMSISYSFYYNYTIIKDERMLNNFLFYALMNALTIHLNSFALNVLVR